MSSLHLHSCTVCCTCTVARSTSSRSSTVEEVWAASLPMKANRAIKSIINWVHQYAFIQFCNVSPICIYSMHFFHNFCSFPKGICKRQETLSSPWTLPSKGLRKRLRNLHLHKSLGRENEHGRIWGTKSLLILCICRTFCGEILSIFDLRVYSNLHLFYLGNLG